MARSYRKIFFHIVWGTKHRSPILRGELEVFVHRRIDQHADDLGLNVLSANSAWDHVHTLTQWNTTQPIGAVVKQWKGSIAREWNERGGERLEWQKGAGIFSVSAHEVERLIGYIAKQKQHHRDRTTTHRYEIFPGSRLL